MSDNNSVFATSNLHTVVAVGFVLALLSIAFNFYNFTRMGQVLEATAIAANGNFNAVDAKIQKLNAKVSALEKSNADLKKQLADAAAKDHTHEPAAASAD